MIEAVFVVDDVMVGWKPGPSSTLGTQQGSGKEILEKIGVVNDMLEKRARTNQGIGQAPCVATSIHT